MQFTTTLPLSNVDHATLEAACQLDAKITAHYVENHGIGVHRMPVHYNGAGEKMWLLNGHCLPTVLITADYMSEAMDEYLEKYVVCDEVSMDDIETTYFTGSGFAYNEETMSYINVFSTTFDKITFTVEGK